MIVIQGRDRPRRARDGKLESLTTEQLLSLHERHFGPLDGESKKRIVEGARTRGWDQDALAA